MTVDSFLYFIRRTGGSHKGFDTPAGTAAFIAVLVVGVVADGVLKSKFPQMNKEKRSSIAVISSCAVGTVVYMIARAGL